MSVATSIRIRQVGPCFAGEVEGLDLSRPLSAEENAAVHAGMDHWPQREDPVFAEIPPEDAIRALQGRRRAIAATVERMPAHHSMLKHVLG